MKSIFKESSFGFRILQLFIVVVFCMYLGVLFGLWLSNGDSSTISYLRTLQFFTSVFTFLIPPFVAAYWWSEKPLSYLQLTQKIDLRAFFIVVILLLIAIPFINLILDLNQRITLPASLSGFENLMKSKEMQAAEQTQRFLETENIQGLLFNLFLMAIIPALSEELFFRGTIQRVFQEYKFGISSIWIAAVVFSAVHFQFYGFIPRMLMGAFFGYVLYWSKNLWLPIIAHFINNALVIISHYLKNNGYTAIDIDSVGIGKMWWLGCVSGIVFIVGFIVLKKYLKQQQTQPLA